MRKSKMRATEPESQQNAAGSAPPAGADAGGERCGGGVSQLQGSKGTGVTQSLGTYTNFSA